MTLQFNPYPVLQRPETDEDRMKPILEGLQTFGQGIQAAHQNRLQDIQSALLQNEYGQKRQAFNIENYGNPNGPGTPLDGGSLLSQAHFPSTSLGDTSAYSSSDASSVSNQPAPSPLFNSFQSSPKPLFASAGMSDMPSSPPPAQPTPQAMYPYQMKNLLAQKQLQSQMAEYDPNSGISKFSRETAGHFVPGLDVPEGTTAANLKTLEPILGKFGRPASGVTTSGLNWETATPSQQNLAKAMVAGNVQPSDLGMRDRATIVTLANEYALNNNLPFQSYGGSVKAGMAKNLAYGKMGMNSLSLNTALGHVSDAMNSYEKIGNTNQAWLNTPINYLKTKTNDPSVIALGLNLNALQGELANVFKGSGATDQEINSWSKYLNESLTPSQYMAASKKIGDLLTSRLNALQYQQGNVMNEPVTGRNLISPKGQHVMDRISGQPSGKPKSVTQNGHTYTLNEATGQYE